MGRAALKIEFPQLPAYAADQIDTIFFKWAIGEDGAKHATLAVFTTMYASFLFRNFDADGNGYLDVDEAQAALEYLSGGNPIRVGLPVQPDGEGHPPGEEKARVGKPWFWAMYQAMMDDV